MGLARESRAWKALCSAKSVPGITKEDAAGRVAPAASELSQPSAMARYGANSVLHQSTVRLQEPIRRSLARARLDRVLGLDKDHLLFGVDIGRSTGERELSVHQATPRRAAGAHPKTFSVPDRAIIKARHRDRQGPCSTPPVRRGRRAPEPYISYAAPRRRDRGGKVRRQAVRYARQSMRALNATATPIQSRPQTTVGTPVTSASMAASERSSGRSRMSLLISRMA